MFLLIQQPGSDSKNRFEGCHLVKEYYLLIHTTMDISNHTDDKVKSQIRDAESKSDAGSVGQGSVLAADFDPSPVGMTATEAMMMWPYAVVWSSIGLLSVIL